MARKRCTLADASRLREQVHEQRWAAIYLVKFLAMRSARPRICESLLVCEVRSASGAIEALAETGPTRPTRALLAQRAVQDEMLRCPQRRASGVGREVAGRDHARPARPAGRPG